MHVIESIGPVLGIAAFVGLAVLAFLLFQQAREIRRLREWAGRAPERATEAAEAVQAAAEAARDATPRRSRRARPRRAGPGRLRGAWAAVSWARPRPATPPSTAACPIDGRYVLVVLAVAVIAAVRPDQRLRARRWRRRWGRHKARRSQDRRPTVAVINGTSRARARRRWSSSKVVEEGRLRDRAGRQRRRERRRRPWSSTPSGMRDEAQELADGGEAEAREDAGPADDARDREQRRARSTSRSSLGLDDAGFGGGG